MFDIAQSQWQAFLNGAIFQTEDIKQILSRMKHKKFDVLTWRENQSVPCTL